MSAQRWRRGDGDAELTEQQTDAVKLFDERVKVARLVDRLLLRDIERLNRVLERLTDDDLRAVAVYAEAMADWNAAP